MKRCWLWLFCLSWLSVVNAADYPGYQRLEPFQVQSADAQRSYQVQLLVPARAAPASGFPVLYLLDGHAALAALKAQWLDELKAGTPPLLVFIGHAGERPFNVPARTLDYTPARRDGQPMQAFNGVQGGGAAVFLALLEQRIKPQVAALQPVDPAQQALWGHSFGGLFVLNTLFTQPASFSRYIAASPSLFWHEALTQREERDFVARLQAGKGSPVARLLVVSGEREEALLERWDAIDLAIRLANLRYSIAAAIRAHAIVLRRV